MSDMSINSSPALNINIQISHVRDTQTAQISGAASPATEPVQASRSFAGRTVTWIRDASQWAMGAAQSGIKATINGIQAGTALVAKKFRETVRSLHEQFQLYRADKKANKEWKLSEARSEKRNAEHSGIRFAASLQPPRSASTEPAHARRIDQETRDIQTRLNLLKLPDVPDQDPSRSH